MASPLVLGIDVSTTGSKALLVDESGAVVASASTPHTLQTPRPLWSEQDPEEWWQATATSIRAALAAVPGASSRVVGIGLTGQMHGLVALDALGNVLRPAILWNDQRTAAECDEIRALVRPRAADPRHRQRRAHRLHRAQDPLGAQQRAGGLRAHRAHPAAERLHPLPSHRRLRDGQGRRLRHDALRSRRPRLVAGGLRRAEHPRRLAAADLRGSRGDGHGDAARGGRDGAAGGHAGGGGRRRSGGGGRRHGHRAPRRRLRHAGHLGRRLRRDGRAADRAGGTPARLLPRRAGALARHGRHARRRRQPAMVPRHARPRKSASPRWSKRPPRRPPAAMACSSCRTSPASARHTPIRWRAAPSSG